MAEFDALPWLLIAVFALALANGRIAHTSTRRATADDVSVADWLAQQKTNDNAPAEAERTGTQ